MKIRYAIWNWGTVAQRRQILFEAIDSYFKNCDFVPDKNIVDSFLSQFNLGHVHEPVIRGVISGFISCEISIIDPHTIGGRFFNYVMNGCDGREDYPDRSVTCL